MYTEQEYKSTLFHHGIKGQRWGVRRYQYENGSLTPEGRIHYGVGERKRYKVNTNRIRKLYDEGYSTQNIKRPITKKNIDKWGKDKDSNVLYVTGLSGSGKSFVAKSIAQEENADVINIDLYTFKTPKGYIPGMSKEFNKYMDSTIPNWKNMQKEAYAVFTKTDRREAYKAGRWFDALEEAIKGYGQYQYPNKKVIAEGVQIIDETLFYNNKKYLKDKPIIIVETSYIDSFFSGMNRDNASLEKLLEPERIKQAENWLKSLDLLKKEAEII